MTARTNTIGAIPVAPYCRRASMTALGAANFPGGRKRQAADRAAGDFSHTGQGGDIIAPTGTTGEAVLARQCASHSSHPRAVHLLPHRAHPIA